MGFPSGLLLHTQILRCQDVSDVRCHKAPHLLALLRLQGTDHVLDTMAGWLLHQQQVGRQPLLLGGGNIQEGLDKDALHLQPKEKAQNQVFGSLPGPAQSEGQGNLRQTPGPQFPPLSNEPNLRRWA